MFNTTILSEKTVHREYVPYEKTVIEKKAPTDESIKLWQEIRDRAYRSIVGDVKINDNSFNCNAKIFHDPCSCTSTCVYRYVLNGKERYDEIKGLDRKISRKQLVRELIARISENLCAEILGSVKMEGIAE